MRIEVVRPLELAPADVAAWRAIRAADATFDSPYLAPEWALALARAVGRMRGRGRVAVLREDGGEAVGFLSARVGRFTAGPMGAPLCDGQALVARPGVIVDPRALVRALGVGRLDLFNLSPPGPFASHLRGQTEALRIDLSRGFDAYAAARRAAGTDILQDAAKKRRKLEREHGPATFTALSPSAADLATLLVWKRAQYRATRQTDIFDAGWSLTLLTQLHASTEPGFGGRLFTLHVGGELVAAHYALQGGPVLHAWFIAHAEPFARYSPGVLLIADMLRWAEGAGVRALDLGPGDYRFKHSLADVRIALAHGFVGRAHPAAAVRGAAYAVRRAAESRDLGRWSALPGKAMRRVDLWRGATRIARARMTGVTPRR